MEYTQAQYDALVIAIAQGVQMVQYGDKKVEYRSLAEMERIKNTMANQLGLNRQKQNTKMGEFSKGISDSYYDNSNF